MGLERLTKSVIARSLGWRATEECAVDRVTAIGLAAHKNEAGDTLLRVNALDGAAMHKIILLCSRRLKKSGIRFEYARRMAIAALHEYLRQKCRHCGGRGSHYQKGAAVRVCPHCGGNGLHYYSDMERAALIGDKYNHRAYEDALAFLRDSVRTLVINADKRLND